MGRYSLLLTTLASSLCIASAASMPACGGANPSNLQGTSSGSSGGSSSSTGSTGSSSGSATSGSGGTSGGSSSGKSSGGTSGGSSGGSSGTDGGVVCPPGLTCGMSCPSGGTTSITGKVYNPAGKDPLYNVAVYVPAKHLQPLPAGVPTGSDACSCSALYKSGVLASTVTGADGSFTLTDVPVGHDVPLVLQVGKWRRSLHIDVTACQTNAQPDKSLTLPGTVAPGSEDNMPDIAVSTGSADTLECLLLRIGLPLSEYVAGAGGGGHVHVFSGGDPSGNNSFGTPEVPPMTGAPQSSTALWDSTDHLMPYDITLLSCEGEETFDAKPQMLEDYLNAGGRVFASHFHYAWFAGPLDSQQAYAAPPDWGANLATWTYDQSAAMGPIGGVVDTTLNGSMKPFPKGVALQKWLTGVGALGVNVPAGELSIYDPRYNATVASTNTPAQPWITSDSAGMAGQAMYFSFDTPVNAPPGPNGGPPQYCGRAVYSDLHVGADPNTGDMLPPPDGCSAVDLSPQEKALEFMLFDLSSCVIPDSVTPPVVVQAPPQ